MFGFFKKPKSQQTPASVPSIPPERAAAINRQFEEFAEGEIDPLEGALAMFQLDRDRYVPQVLKALATATVELLLSENNPRSAPLMLRSANGYPMLAVFTQRRRSAKCQQHYPENQFYLRVPFPMALHSLREGAGLVINPYEEVITWELPPDLVNIVKETIRSESKSPAKPPPLPPR